MFKQFVLSRLKEKEALLLQENSSQLEKWKSRVTETEQEYDKKIKSLTHSHGIEIEDLKNKNKHDLDEQHQLRKDELCAVLSVQQNTEVLDQLTDKVKLSAEEIKNLAALLDLNR